MYFLSGMNISKEPFNVIREHVIGYHHDIEWLRNAVLNNDGDIFDCLYDHMLITYCPEGLGAFIKPDIGFMRHGKSLDPTKRSNVTMFEASEWDGGQPSKIQEIQIYTELKNAILGIA